MNAPVQRLTPSEVARILLLIDTVPNRRNQPRSGDLSGQFDFWFDGGACQYVTGSTKYHFADGTRATIAVLPKLWMGIDFPDGRSIVLQERDVQDVTAGL